MDNQQDPANQLNDEDQKSAVDVVAAAFLIGLRIPSAGKPLFDWMVTEFASCHDLPRNMIRYALQHIGQSLTSQDWTLEIEKNGDRLTTRFRPVKSPQNNESDPH